MSLYKLIENSILENGVLQKDFSLPKEKEEGKLQFVDGGMDGIFMYHMMKNEANIEDLSKALILVNKKKNHDALRILHKYFEKERAHSNRKYYSSFNTRGASCRNICN